MNPAWYSSYEQNNYGELFYSLVRIYQPEKVVELGTETGYSAYHMARALKDNGKGHLDCYDLWENYSPEEDYGFYNASKSEAEENLKEFKDKITLNLADVIGIDKNYGEIDILHIDLHNDGKILAEVIPRWIDKTGITVIEGGSLERDQIDSMNEFNRAPIKKWLEEFKAKRGDIEYITLEPFPSITIIRKR